MELHNQLKQLADKIEELKEKIETEESTKHAFVLPFINLLGYDTYNPLEVVPEFTADQGIKKGEKVDYAIFQDGEPILIIECKHWKENLDVHNSQLFRYFHVTKTRFALLTNGIDYRFYTDLESGNKMDERSFLDFDIRNLKEATVNEISKFHKSNFDVDKIVNNASSLKYTKALKKALNQEFENPSADFVKFFAKKVYSGKVITESVRNEFSELIKRAVSQMISEKVNARLNSALSKEEEHQKQESHEEEPEEKPKVVTTEEELEGYRIIVAILRRKLPIERIAHRDTQSYFGVLLDDNNRKPICRLHLNSANKYIGIFDENKKEERHFINSIDDIYKFEDQLLKTITYYE